MSYKRIEDFIPIARLANCKPEFLYRLATMLRDGGPPGATVEERVAYFQQLRPEWFFHD
jgi:hypothetical protein